MNLLLKNYLIKNHITGSGYTSAYSIDLVYKKSFLTDAMNKVWEEKFTTVAKKYPKGAWYSYYDKTCSCVTIDA